MHYKIDILLFLHYLVSYSMKINFIFPGQLHLESIKFLHLSLRQETLGRSFSVLNLRDEIKAARNFPSSPSLPLKFYFQVPPCRKGLKWVSGSACSFHASLGQLFPAQNDTLSLGANESLAAALLCVICRN